MIVNFFVPGRPRSTQTGSVVRVNGRSIPLRRGTSWASVCGLIARQHAPDRPCEGPVAVSLVFVMPRPKKKAAKGRRYVETQPDLENLSKGLLDAWNGVLYRDDRQVVELHATKVYEDDRLSVGVVVTVEDLVALEDVARALGMAR